MIVKKVEQFEAFRYGGLQGVWYTEAATDVINFITGVNTDNQTTVSNERMLDVVRPDMYWTPPLDVDLYIVDPITRVTLQLRIGSWVLKTKAGGFQVFLNEDFEKKYLVEPVEKPEETFRSELAYLIQKYGRANGLPVSTVTLARHVDELIDVALKMGGGRV